MGGDWVYVEIGERTGWVPKNYFELSNKNDYSLLWEPVTIPDMSFSESIYSEIDMDLPGSLLNSGGRGSLKELHESIATATCDFTALDDTMVDLSHGEKVIIMERPLDKEWWYVRKQSIDGDVTSCYQGWVPSSHLE